MSAKPGSPTRYTRQARPLPVSRAAHWELRCGCGAILSHCPCQASCVRHVEVWANACQWVQRYYGPHPSPSTPPAPITLKTPGQDRFIQSFPRQPLPPPPITTPRDRRVSLPPDVVALLIPRWEAGERMPALVRDTGLKAWQISEAMRTLGIVRGSIRAFAGEEATLRRLLAEGLSRQAIARQYGLSVELLNLELRTLGIYGTRGRKRHA